MACPWPTGSASRRTIRLKIRTRLGWPQNRPVVLLVGGGEGMGPLEPTARAIDAAGLPVQLVIIAGRNKKLKERLERYPLADSSRRFTVLCRKCLILCAPPDILVTKAGPGTISEAFIAGLPMILYSRLPGQEDGNVGYVVDNGAGVWAPRPDAVVAALRNWLSHPDQQTGGRSLPAPGSPKGCPRDCPSLAAQVGIFLSSLRIGQCSVTRSVIIRLCPFSIPAPWNFSAAAQSRPAGWAFAWVRCCSPATWFAFLVIWALERPRWCRELPRAGARWIPVSSPTFVLVNEYRRPDGHCLFHLDAYRLANWLEAEDLDLDRMLETGPLMIEWPERIKEVFPPGRLWIHLALDCG